MNSSYLIKNATVVSIDPTIGIQENCDVFIHNGTIEAVQQGIKAPEGVDVIDGSNCIVSPGFVDTHRHTWQTQLRTVCCDHVLTDYVLAIRNKYGSCYTARDAYLGNYGGALESIDNGITFLIDHSHIMNSPEHADAAVNGLKDSKIRGVFCYGLFKNPPWNGSTLDYEKEVNTPNWRFDDARRVRDVHFKSNEPHDVLRFGFAPAELERCTYEEAIQEIEHGRSLGSAVITGHIAMGKYDTKHHLVRHFNEKQILKNDLLFSHGASLASDELDAIHASGAAISVTPDTEMQMGMGHPVAFKARDHGCTASLGVDIVSNNPADMFQQMRLVLQAQRHLENEAQDKPLSQVARRCYDVLEMATQGGATAVGLGEIIGSITPGKRADLLITKCDSLRLSGVPDPVAAIVMYANGSDIDTVFIDGVVVKSGGRLTGVDMPKVLKDLRDSAEGIMERSKRAPVHEVEAAAAALMRGEQYGGVKYSI
ncbi:5-methylthioadenosine/S-adenosylhomocysteine deaminase [Cyphellophora attinorum]|uniref:5-methylthioadenosine/S-adenosylhomocysteine deaminase n=1 Tax=Cyphellophora attinorum TaxID=1664694 RepID=A0A0N0NS13_9EURO|nr:5-methylthioadenosine/S-adenosylhomocysteine deaminase [Phialophora attinorum]KPI45469.1 5-methylthioadenosine/S-adenosylhomocysteine deaminase [Phialophora attinorum]